jgi:hypothetical protein
LFILTANGVLPVGSGTIRHNTQNNRTIKRNTAHKTTPYTEWLQQSQLHKLVLTFNGQRAPIGVAIE